MMTYKRLFYQFGVLLFALFAATGCGSNNSQTVPANAPDVPDGNVTTVSYLFVSDITVSQNGESATVRVQALTKNYTPALEGSIGYQITDTDSFPNGSLSPAVATISDGFASFTYTAPENLQNQIDSGNTGTSFLLYNMEDSSLNVPLNVTFDTSADTTSDPIAALLLDPVSVNVTEASESFNITVTGLSTSGGAVANGIAYVEWPDTGNINPGVMSSEVQIVNGTGSFTYTAPSDPQALAAISPIVFKLYDKATSQLLTTFQVGYSSTNIAPSITVNPSTVTVSTAGEGVPVTVLATDSNGKAITSGTIEVLNVVGASAGTFSASEVALNSAGQAIFQYSAPTPLNLGSANFTFRYKENSAYRATWRVVFSQDVGEATNPITTLISSGDITASTAGETIPINISAFIGSGAYAQTGSVSVRPQNQIPNIGSFTQTQVDVGTNGIATFQFIAPDPIDDTLADQTFIFTSDSGVSTQMSVNYESQPVSGSIYPERINVFVNNQAVSDVNITKNGEVKSILLRVWGNDDQPFDGGNIKIKYPLEAIEGTADVGYFSELVVPCVNGIATFTYNAPSNLSGRDGDSFEFSFYHDSADSQAGDIPLTFTIHPDAGQIVITTYELLLQPSDGNNTMGIESIKAFTTMVVDEDGNEISDGNFTITNLNPDIADILDSNGSASDVLNKTNEQNVVFRIESLKQSGLIPLKISVDFIDINGDSQNIETVFNIVVYSGPPTSISINYATTDFDQAYAEFTEHFVVTVSDQYGNPVNTRPAISVGAIIGYATSNPADAYDPANYIYFQPNGTTTGSIDTSIDQFTTTNTILGNIDQSGNDKLVVIPENYHYDAGGKWDYLYVSNNTLNLVDDYNGANRSGLGFAVGNNQRVRTCEIGAKENATVSTNGSNILDEQGRVLVDMAYRPYLVGKDIILWVNIIGFKLEDDVTTRVGTGRKFTLQGNGLLSDSFTVAKLTAGTVRFLIGQDSVNRQPYFNANFVGNVESTGTVAITGISYSPVDDCSATTPGQAWVDVSYTGGADGGSITIAPTVAVEIQ